MEKITVIIPCYNVEKYICECLENRYIKNDNSDLMTVFKFILKKEVSEDELKKILYEI